jgi:transcription elongation factor GreA
MATEMSAESYESLRAEIERLETDERPRMAEQIKTAREFGDLKENAEYHAAKDASGHLETRILKLKEQLAGARVVEVGGGDVVGFGSSVEVEDPQSGKRATYRIVAAHESAPGDGLVSLDSPVGAALNGRRPGDDAVVKTPRGERTLKVLAVS